jgi:hypothetical protein
MLSPGIQILERDQINSIFVNLSDAGSPLLGLTSSDLLVYVAKPSSSVLSPVSSLLDEVSSGLYQLTLSDLTVDGLGYYAIYIKQGASYVGNIDSVYMIASASPEGLPVGYQIWAPIFLSLSGVPVAGLDDLNVASVSTVIEEGTEIFASVGSTSFRELLETGTGVGFYQVLLTPDELLTPGDMNFKVISSSSEFDAYQSTLKVHAPTNKPIYITIKDSQDIPSVGVTVYACKNSDSSIVSQGVSDGVGQVSLSLPPETYRLVLSSGSSIFHENNKQVIISDSVDSSPTYINLLGDTFTPSFPLPDTDTVEMTARISSIDGTPVERAQVDIINTFNPGVRASDNSLVVGNKTLTYYSDANGILQDKVRGKPRLLKGAIVDIVIKGTNITRQGVVVPNTDFDLADLLLTVDDVFTVQKINLIRPPTSSL